MMQPEIAYMHALYSINSRFPIRRPSAAGGTLHALSLRRRHVGGARRLALAVALTVMAALPCALASAAANAAPVPVPAHATHASGTTTTSPANAAPVPIANRVRAYSVIDDSGATVTLPRPAQRIVSLAPHLTELTFAAGAGSQLVGVVSYSDYPEAAKRIPRVGDNRALDLERIAALKPDLILVWRHGNAEQQLDALRSLHIPMYISAPHTVEDVATTLDKLGVLFGTTGQAQQAARAYRAKIAALRARYANAAPISVFYQVWDSPLMTLNGTHWISDVLALCGGRNVFAQSAPLVPTVSREAVIALNPDVIMTAGAGATRSSEKIPGLEFWQAWPALTAVAHRNLFVIDGDLIDRPTPRLADGATQVCEDLAVARGRLH